MQKRARRKEGNENSLVKVIAEMHNTQLETMEAYQKRSEEFMLKLEQEQRKLEEDSKRGDQEFFFRMAELLKNRNEESEPRIYVAISTACKI